MTIDEEFAERFADILAGRVATRFHAIGQGLKGGTLGGNPGPGQANPVTQNQWGGKGIIKFNPSNNEVVAGTKQQVSLFTWQSPDGLPHDVTVEIGRLAAGVGGPGADGTKGGLTVVNPATIQGQGSVGGGSWPAGSDATGVPLSYRAVAQVVIGTPGTMQDPFFVDINRGQRFTALASYVAVTAQMNAPPVDEVSGNPITPPGYTKPYASGSLAVYATLGAAEALSLAPVLYTQFIDTAPSQAGALFQFVRTIPPRANTMYPVISSNNTDNVQLIFFDNAGIQISNTGFGTTLKSPMPLAAQNNFPLTTPIPLPLDCYGYVVSSTGGFASNYRVIFQLSV